LRFVHAFESLDRLGFDLVSPLAWRGPRHWRNCDLSHRFEITDGPFRVRTKSNSFSQGDLGFEMIETGDTTIVLGVTKSFRPWTFRIDFTDGETGATGISATRGRQSIVVRFELDGGLFSTSRADPERSASLFAESLARQIAFLAVEKDFPNGVELSSSICQIDHLPSEISNRFPDLCVNGHDAWVVVNSHSTAR